MNKARQLTLKDIKLIFPEIANRFHFKGSAPIGEESSYGAVWKAFDTWLDRYVAIKISHDVLKDEVSLCRDIDGHTVRVYDYYVADGWEAYSMELLSDEWISLSSYIDKCELKGRDIQHYFTSFEIMRAILLGLEDIHGAPYKRKNRIVHSDIKPDNLFILNKFKRNSYSVFTMPSNERLVKFIDLGVSSCRGDLRRGGTPAYQHPEISNFSQTGNDIYALSITFLELLTGVRPDYEDMRHKSRIYKFVSDNSSGSSFIDSIAVEIVTKCARAAKKDNANVRVVIRYMDESISGISSLYFILLREIVFGARDGLSKSELAEYIFKYAARYYNWKNRTVDRIEQLKWLVTDMYEKRILRKKIGSNIYYP